MIYGYARISRKTQSIDRQIRNIKREYPEAVISKEAYTGTKMDRPEWIKLYNKLRSGDTLVFDQVSRMSRDSEEGFRVYEELYKLGVNLVFLKEPHINTDVYKDVAQVQNTGDKDLDETFIKAINEYFMRLAKRQIKLAFEQAEKEVTDLHQRTREGIETARIKGKQIGQIKGKKLFSRKAEKAKIYILENCSAYEGDKTLYKIANELNLTTAVIYKYNNELKELHIRTKKDFLRFQTELFGDDRWIHKEK